MITLKYYSSTCDECSQLGRTYPTKPVPIFNKTIRYTNEPFNNKQLESKTNRYLNIETEFQTYNSQPLSQTLIKNQLIQKSFYRFHNIQNINKKLIQGFFNQLSDHKSQWT